MKPSPTPSLRIPLSPTQPTKRAPEVTANDNGARFFSSGLKPIGKAYAAVLEKARPK